MTGGYEEGYNKTQLLWGKTPGSLISKFSELFNDFQGKDVLDIGAGEGKNSIWFAERGANVLAVEVSAKAIQNGLNEFGEHSNITWANGDFRELDVSPREFDLVIMYGFLHCLSTKEEVIDVVKRIQGLTKVGGLNILCAFNSRRQELDRAHPSFFPVLLEHEDYVSMYGLWQNIFASDENLLETHPHNHVQHTHSMTRIVARRLAENV